MQTVTSPDGRDGGRMRGPLFIVTGLFFMWGLLTSLNDVLIPHLKLVYSLTYVQAMLVQLCFFGAYFLVSLPAGRIVRKLGYQKGVVCGLVVAAIGCALFYPASLGSYELFLFALFVLASGITILQVAANPYVTVLGPAVTASSRLTLTQAFNSLGTAIAPILGGWLILSASGSTKVGQATAAPRSLEAAAVQGPYLGLALTLVVLAVLFALVKLPVISETQVEKKDKSSIFRHRNLTLGMVAIFLYVGAEVSIGSFLINFLGERDVAGLSAEDAAHKVSFYWAGAMIGRFIGVALMSRLSPGKVLASNAIGAIALLLVAIFSHSEVAMWSVLAVGLMNSIMFPTIFSMALHDLGSRTSEASGILCMAIVGGAVMPFAQGLLADSYSLRLSFIIPALCYAFVVFYGWYFADMYRNRSES